jgi:hypothetical protein
VYAFKVEVSLVQTVRLTRDPKRTAFPSTTWSANAIGLTTPKRLDIIYEPLREKVGDFIKDFNDVNPKLAIGMLSARDTPIATLPEEVSKAQLNLKDWLNSLNDKSRSEVEKTLGAASEEATWEFRGQKLPLLRYKTGSGGMLALYFNDNRVIKASLPLLSE